MKTLKDYLIDEMSINEMALFTKEEINKVFGSNGAKIAKFADSFINDFLSEINKKEKEYSVNNKQHVGYLWNSFNKSTGAKFSKDDLKKYHCSSSSELRAILGDNLDLINKIIGKNKLKSSDSKIKREYKEWESSDRYMPLEDYDKNDEYLEDEEAGRAFVIYYAYDPADTDLVKVYRVNGKVTNPNTKHEMNLHRMDWNQMFKLGYYHANTCTVEHYRKSGKEELMREYNDDLSYDD